MSAEAKQTPIASAASARVFFALWPSPELAAELAAIAGGLALSFGGRPTRSDTIHLTLAFLGDVPTSRLPELAALPTIAAAEPFTLHFDRLGFWPHNHLLWMGCRVVPALQHLVDELRRQLADAAFVIGEPARSFFPHVTLVRRLPSGITPELPRLVRNIDWPCTAFRLLASSLSAEGPSYRTLVRYRLDG